MNIEKIKCSICGKILEFTKENFHMTSRIYGNFDGHGILYKYKRKECKKCRNIQRKKYYWRERNMTKEDFLKILKGHDWHYGKTDDMREYRKGRKTEEKINHILDTHPELRAVYSEFMGDGAIWIDTENEIAGTETGTANNLVSTWEEAVKISSKFEEKLL